MTRYCLSDEEVSGFRSVSLFPVRSHSVFTTRGEGKLAYHAHTGNLYTKKSPTATNSSVAHEQKDVNEVDDRAHNRCNTAAFSKFALFGNIGGVIGGR